MNTQYRNLAVHPDNIVREELKPNIADVTSPHGGDTVIAGDRLPAVPAPKKISTANWILIGGIGVILAGGLFLFLRKR